MFNVIELAFPMNTDESNKILKISANDKIDDVVETDDVNDVFVEADEVDNVVVKADVVY